MPVSTKTVLTPPTRQQLLSFNAVSNYLDEADELSTAVFQRMFDDNCWPKIECEIKKFMKMSRRLLWKCDLRDCKINGFGRIGKIVITGCGDEWREREKQRQKMKGQNRPMSKLKTMSAGRRRLIPIQVFDQDPDKASKGGKGKDGVSQEERAQYGRWVRVKKLTFWVPGYGDSYDKDKDDVLLNEDEDEEDIPHDGIPNADLWRIKSGGGFFSGGVKLFRSWCDEFNQAAHRHIIDYYKFDSVIGGFNLMDKMQGNASADEDDEEDGISTVALAEDRMTEERVAVKVIRSWDKRKNRPLTAEVDDYDDNQNHAKERQRQWAKNEPSILMELNKLENLQNGSVTLTKNLHTPKVLDVFLSAEKTYMIIEYIGSGTLDAYMKKHGKMKELDAAFVMRGLLRALRLAHSRHIAHRDVKPEQILLRSVISFKKGIVLCDWGLARRLPKSDDENESDLVTNHASQTSSAASPTYPPLCYSDDDTLLTVSPEDLDSLGNYIGPICGSPGFLAPEVVRRQAHDTRADVWAAGICLHYMLTGLCPFDSLASVPQALQLIGSLRGEASFSQELWKDASAEAQNLCRSMLHADPDMRLTAEEALQHPFFAQCEIDQFETMYMSQATFGNVGGISIERLSSH